MSETYTSENAIVLEYKSKSGQRTIAKTVYPEARNDAYGQAVLRTQARDPRAAMLLQDDGSPDVLPWLQDDDEMHTIRLQQVRVAGDTVTRVGEPVTVQGRLRKPRNGDELSIIRQVVGSR